MPSTIHARMPWPFPNPASHAYIHTIRCAHAIDDAAAGRWRVIALTNNFSKSDADIIGDAPPPEERDPRFSVSSERAFLGWHEGATPPRLRALFDDFCDSSTLGMRCARVLSSPVSSPVSPVSSPPPPPSSPWSSPSWSSSSPSSPCCGRCGCVRLQQQQLARNAELHDRRLPCYPTLHPYSGARSHSHSHSEQEARARHLPPRVRAQRDQTLGSRLPGRPRNVSPSLRCPPSAHPTERGRERSTRPSALLYRAL